MEDGDDISLETVSRHAAGDWALGKSISLPLAARSASATESVLGRLGRAKNRRNTPHRGDWQPGDRVFFWRSQGPKREAWEHWRGPTAVNSTGIPGKAYLSFRGGIILRSWKQLRAATES